MHSYISSKSPLILRRATPQLMGQYSRAAFSNKIPNPDGLTFKGGHINLGIAVFVREKYACLVHRL